MMTSMSLLTPEKATMFDSDAVIEPVDDVVTLYTISSPFSGLRKAAHPAAGPLYVSQKERILSFVWLVLVVLRVKLVTFFSGVLRVSLIFLFQATPKNVL